MVSQVAAEHGSGDQLGDLGNLVVAFFDRVQGLAALLQVLLVFLVPGRRGGIDVPADVVETGLLDEGFDVFLALALQFAESDNDVRDLHTGVVDVILHVDRIAVEAQQADEGVAEDRIAQVSDVRGLVRIDGAVLDENLGRSATAEVESDLISAVAASARDRRALMYPAPATSRRSKPSTLPRPATISSAILRGALRRRLASSNESGRAYSPNSTLGGCSMTMVGRSSPYCC